MNPSMELGGDVPVADTPRKGMQGAKPYLSAVFRRRASQMAVKRK